MLNVQIDVLKENSEEKKNNKSQQWRFMFRNTINSSYLLLTLKKTADFIHLGFI